MSSTTATQYPLAVLARQNGAQQLIPDLEAAGFQVRCVESLDRVIEPGVEDTHPVLIYSLSSLSNDVLEEIRLTKLEQPQILFICAISHFREAKRLRLIEAGADEGVPMDQLQDQLQSLLPQFSPSGVEQPPAAKEQLAPGESSGNETPPAGQMFFQLAHGELSNALQFLCMSPRVGRLRVQFEDGVGEANLYLANQAVVYVESGEHKGVMAMADIINHPGARNAVFYEGEEAPEQRIEQPLSQFLLEASVMADEERAQEAG